MRLLKALQKTCSTLFLFCLLVIICRPVSPVYAAEARVLVISSYHIGYGGTDPMIEGIKTAFTENNQNVHFHFEYLDSKRFAPKDIFPVTEKLFHRKYGGKDHSFDVIIVADNNAFTFLGRIRDDLFADTPVVFCGINNFRDAMLAGMPLTTGVVEDISLKETVDLALSLHPGTTHLAVISDSTTTGRANLEKFRAIKARLPRDLDVLELSDLSADELARQLESLPQNTVLLQLSFYVDREGRKFTQKEQMEFICAHCDKPIYSAWDFFIANGVLGGVVTYFPLQGKSAGEMAVRILRGTPVAELPVIRSSPNVPLFDFQTLEKFDIASSALPAASIVLNRPASFYSRHRVLVWGLALFILCQAAAIGMLMIVVRRKRMSETRLVESEERFQKAMEANQDGLWDWMISSGEVYYSPGYAAMLGYDSTEVPQHVNTWLELIHPDDRDEAFRINQECIENRIANFQVEFRMQHRDGSWRWILGRGMAVNRDADGRALRMIGTHTDITDRKELENALRRGESKMRSLFRAAPIGIGVVTQRVFTEVNHRFCDMLGYTKAELLNRDSRMLYCNDTEYEYVGREKYRQISENGLGTVETRMQRKDGEVLEILLSSCPLNPEDLREGVSFTALDITKSKQTERRLRESEEKYRSMMEAMIDPVYISSPDRKLVYLNPAMIRRIGRDATGERCSRAVHGLDGVCPWCRFFETGHEKHYELDIVSPLDNRSFHVSNSPLPQPDGSIHKLTVFRDTTEMKLVQSRLQQAQKMESIGNLAGGVAHDFNNILGVITGYGELAEKALPEDSPVKRNIHMVLVAADRAKDLVKQILTFSRKSSQEKKPVQLLQVVQETLKMLRSSLPSTITIESDLKLNEELVFADPTGLHQVLMNLGTNAFHSMENKKGTLRVSLEQRYVSTDQVTGEWNIAGGRFAVLRVEDDGRGIDRETLDQIFVPYYTTKERGEGTGLGLAVVHGIVKDCGGFIEVESEPGLGSIFSVYLPIEEQQPADTSPHALTGELATGHEHILFVDDEQSLCEIGESYLHSLGYRVTAVCSSREALDTFKDGLDRFDMIISDLTMPEMTGIELAAEVFTLRPGLPFIICTGYSSAISKEDALKAGISSFLEKPYTINQLADCVRSALDKTQ